MVILGKTSVGSLSTVRPPSSTIKIDITTKVYGLRRAMRTSWFMYSDSYAPPPPLRESLTRPLLRTNQRPLTFFLLEHTVALSRDVFRFYHLARKIGNCWVIVSSTLSAFGSNNPLI